MTTLATIGGILAVVVAVLFGLGVAILVAIGDSYKR